MGKYDEILTCPLVDPEEYDAVFEDLVDIGWSDVEQLLFFEFCLLGAGRSVKILLETVKEKYRDREAIQKLTPVAVRNYALRHDWASRAHEYDYRVFKVDASAIMARNREMNLRHARLAQAMMDKAVDTIQRLDRQGKFGSTAAVQLFKESVMAERLANEAELPKDKQPDLPVINISISTDTSLPHMPQIPGVIVDASD